MLDNYNPDYRYTDFHWHMIHHKDTDYPQHTLHIYIASDYIHRSSYPLHKDFFQFPPYTNFHPDNIFHHAKNVVYMLHVVLALN